MRIVQKFSIKNIRVIAFAFFLAVNVLLRNIKIFYRGQPA